MPNTILSEASAVVLASGRGTRLGELTLATPKPLLPFGGRPYIKYLLDWLIAAGIRDIVVTACTHADQIQSFIGSVPEYGGVVHVVVEAELVSTSESARAGLAEVVNPQSLILTADTIWDVSLSDLYEHHVRHDAAVTAMAFANPKADLPHVIPYLQVRRGDDHVIDMNTPPHDGDDDAIENLATSGLYVVNTPLMLEAIHPEDVSLERESMNRLLPRVYVYRNEGLLLDYGLVHNYELLSSNPGLIRQYYDA